MKTEGRSGMLRIGDKIKQLRKARGVTQEQLANSIGVTFQAVSKWENGITLPDIALAPALAGYFGVTMDELFDYDVQRINDEVMKIAEETWPLRESDTEKGKELIYKGLKEYPENDILLENLLYLENYKNDPDKTIDIALRDIDATSDNSIKYDALRFLAYAYKEKNDIESAKAALMQIPEIYFSRLSELAYITTGEEKRNAAEKQIGVSLGILCEMLTRRAEDMVDKHLYSDARTEYERALKLLDIFDAVDGGWVSYREFFADKVQELQQME